MYSEEDDWRPRIDASYDKFLLRRSTADLVPSPVGFEHRLVAVLRSLEKVGTSTSNVFRPTDRISEIREDEWA